jgi:orotidine-5'-phosphate decarboxylase
MNALEKLKNKNNEGKFICVGLDSDINKIPVHLKKMDEPVLEFNKAIINSTVEYAAAFKINFAFYESLGYTGLSTLEKTIKLIPEDILIIADAKRGDIGNTSAMYAKAVFDNLLFDSITINPYMGEDSILPFLSYQDKIIFVLTLTSNPGSEDFEKMKLQNGLFVFQQVIEKVKKWNKNNNCGIVFGATKPEELRQNIQSFDSLPVLLPGVGAQGGSLDDVVNTFKQNGRNNYIVNVSRGIIYKSNNKDFYIDAENEIKALNNNVNKLLGY